MKKSVFTIVFLTLLCALFACNSSKSVSEENQLTVSSSSTNPETSAKKELELWTSIGNNESSDLVKRIELSEYKLYKCNYDRLKQKLDSETPRITLPCIDGFKSFELENSGTMNEALAAKYPEIRSFKGKSTDGKFDARVDTNEKGLFVEVTGVDGYTSMIAPFYKNNQIFYAIYPKNAVTENPRDKTFEK